jgi:putative SOS response-associated peptidase YedK
VCNLYSLTKGQAAVRDLVRALRDLTGNIPPLPGIFPDYPAPIVRTGADGVREGVTNIRNVGSPHWRRWLGPPSRCIVPFTSFSENDRDEAGKAVPVWFALDESRPLAVFAGLWTSWTSTRKVAEGEVTCDLYGFLTTEPKREVGALHPKAMPVILT